MDCYPSIHDFPDRCLFLVFDNLPLIELINIEKVCKRWETLQPAACERRTTLACIQGQADLDLLRRPKYGSELIEHVRRDDGTPWVHFPKLSQIAANALQVPSELESETSQWLVNTFPLITHLTIVQRYVPNSALEQLIFMLNRWGPGIVSLNLHIWHDVSMVGIDDQNDLVDNVNTLIDTINGLQCLVHLKVNLRFPDLRIEPKLPILYQLRSFTWRSIGVNSGLDTDLLCDSLQQYATPNPRLREVDIENPFTLARLLHFEQSLAEKFSHVVIEDYINADDDGLFYEGIRRFGHRFSAVNMLHINLGTMPLTMLARCLHHMRALTFVELSTKEVFEEELFEPVFGEGVHRTAVRVLSLNITTESHHDIARLQLPEIFPRLQVIYLSQTSCECPDCDYRIDPERNIYATESEPPEELIPELAYQIETCMAMARVSLRQLPMLHTINVNDRPRMPWNRKFISVDDLI